jgi:predicted MFS family arabinose efflux permease
MVLLDQAMIGLISPAVRRHFDSTQSIINLTTGIATLMSASFILGGVTIGDHFGRRRCMVAASAGLLVVSVLSALSVSVIMLVVLRAVAGICEAFITPLALATITVTFNDAERPRAIGLYSASLGLVGTLGTVMVQFLNQLLGWRGPFAITMVLAATSVVLLRRFVPESPPQRSTPIDVPGVLICALGLFLLVFGINQASGSGGFADPASFVPIAAGLLVLIGFVWWESRAAFPALPLKLFSSRQFSAGVTLAVIIAFAQSGAYYHLSLFLQVLQRIDPLGAALSLMPLGLSIFVFSIVAGRLQGRIAVRSLITGGLLIFGVAMVLLSFAPRPELSMPLLIVATIGMGLGFGLANTPRVNAVVSSAPPELSGPASASSFAFYQLGSSLGIAGMGAVSAVLSARAYSQRLAAAGFSPAQIQEATDILQRLVRENASAVASQFAIPINRLDGLVGLYREAYAIGFAQTILVGAGVVFGGAVIAWIGFRPQAAARLED